MLNGKLNLIQEVNDQWIVLVLEEMVATEIPGAGLNSMTKKIVVNIYEFLNMKMMLMINLKFAVQYSKCGKMFIRPRVPI